MLLFMLGVRAAFQAISFPADTLVYQQQKIWESWDNGSVRCNAGMLATIPCEFIWICCILKFISKYVVCWNGVITFQLTSKILVNSESFANRLHSCDLLTKSFRTKNVKSLPRYQTCHSSINPCWVGTPSLWNFGNPASLSTMPFYAF